MRRRALVTMILSASVTGCLRSQVAEESPTATSSNSENQSESVEAEPTKTNTQEEQSETTATRDPPQIEAAWQVPFSTTYSGAHTHFESSFIVGNPEASYTRLNYDGSKQWSQEIGVDASESISTREAVAKETLVLGGQTQLYGLDIESGEVQWVIDIPSQESNFQDITTEMVAADGIVLCCFSYKTTGGDDKAGLCGVESSSGTVRWTKTHDQITDQYENWLALQSLSPPIDGKTVVGGWNHDFWVDIATGEILGSPGAGARYQSMRTNSHLYLTFGGDLRAFAINGGSLDEDWTFEPLGRPSTAPTAEGETAYIMADDSGLYAVDDGEQQWRVQLETGINPPPVVTDEAVWVAGGNMYRVTKDGKQVVEKPSVGQIQYAVSTDGEFVFVSGNRSTIAYVAN